MKVRAVAISSHAQQAANRKFQASPERRGNQPPRQARLDDIVPISARLRLSHARVGYRYRIQGARVDDDAILRQRLAPARMTLPTNSYLQIVVVGITDDLH